MVKHVSEKPAVERSDSRFKGVRKRKWGKWVSEIRLPNSRERIWLGSYDSPEKAARAFDAAMFCLRGRSAKFNFPDNPPEIAGGTSFTTCEIQAAAARFANSEPPRTHSEQSNSGFQTESPSPSVSDATIQLDSEIPMDGSFLDLLTMDSGNSVSEPPSTHSEQSNSGFQTESPSPSVSDATLQLDSEIPMDGSFLDNLNMGSGNFISDYGLFPGFDDFSSGFLGSSMPNFYCEDENLDGILVPDSFLWNF